MRRVTRRFQTLLAMLTLLAAPTFGRSGETQLTPGQAAHPKKAPPDTCMNLPGGGRLGRPDGKRAFATIVWTDTNTLNVAFKDGTDPWNRSVQEKLKTIVKEWEDYANIHFTFDPNKAADILIQFVPDAVYPYYGVYQSLLGPNSRDSREGGPSMWLQFEPNTDDKELKRVILHEFGHALGLTHEQKRPDAGLKWNEDKVYQEYSFTGWSKEQIFEQVMKPETDPAVNKTPFDTNSIMIYPIAKGLANIVVELDE